ncbi:unnamed protein product [Caenorhabditis brenneri]
MRTYNSVKEIPVRDRQVILSLGKDHPCVRNKRDDQGLEPWKIMSQDLKKKGIDVDPHVLRNFVFCKKKYMKDKLRVYIKCKKLSKRDVDEKLKKWNLYSHFEYHRKDIKDYEERLWTERCSAPVVNGSASNACSSTSANSGGLSTPANTDILYEIMSEKRQFLPVATVVSANTQLFGSARLKVASNFDAEIPRSCQEAIRAQEHGKICREREYPGIPSKKFTRDHRAEFGKALTYWPIQSVYELGDTPGEYLVCYEGWTTSIRWTEEYLSEEREQKAIMGMKIRDSFLAEMEKSHGAQAEMVERWHCTNKSDAMFWDFEDLSYFHSMAQKESGLGPVFYMNLTNDRRKPPPSYSFTTTNIMEVPTYERCLASDAHLSFKTLKARNNGSVFPVAKQTGCENPKGCVCNKRFQYLYGEFDINNLQTDKNGLLDVAGLNKDSHRISIECSDECGCSHKCPRRHVQRGQPKPFVVNYEGPKKGNCLRAAADFKKGEFLGEYTGYLKLPMADDDQSYEASVDQMVDGLVICAKKCGNAMRFMSHSCSANAIFILTWSRVKETDPLIPRIAVFALKDIKMGQEVTISYWTSTGKQSVENSVRCWCQTSDCMGWIPTAVNTEP